MPEGISALERLAISLRGQAMPRPWSQLCLRVLDWPTALPPAPAPPVKPVAWYRRLIEWLVRRFRPSRGAKGGPMPEPVVDGTTLERAHLELVERNLERAVTWAGPLWYDLPLAVRTSESGLVAALGPRCGELRKSPPLESEPPGPPIRLLSEDWLALHLEVEARVTALASELGTMTRDPRRRLGGLRTKTFLSVYPRLCDRHGWQAAAEMTGVIDSPLSRWIYLDLVSPRSTERDTVPVAFPEIEPATGSLWIPLVARSLVAACFSPDLSVDSLIAARARVAAEEDRLRARHQRAGWFGAQAFVGTGRLGAARRQEAIALDACRRSFAERWIRLAGLCANHEVLRLRFLDLLVRHLVVASREAMLRQWRYKPKETLQPARRLLFQPPLGACFRTFRQTLVGADWTGIEAWHGQQGSSGRRSRPPESMTRAIETLFTLPDPEDFADGQRLRELAASAGISETEASGLLDRVWKRPVAIPLSPPNAEGYAPAFLVTDWAVAIRNEIDTRHSTGGTP